MPDPVLQHRSGVSLEQSLAVMPVSGAWQPIAI
jgi:hypothetical protein